MLLLVNAAWREGRGHDDRFPLMAARVKLRDKNLRGLMPPRSLTPFESPIADAVACLGSQKGWEFGASLEAPQGPLIELLTRMRRDGADPSSDVVTHARKGMLVSHHNHLTQESLSAPDWNGMLHLFDETWAHCIDGTQYYGRAIDKVWVSAFLAGGYGNAEVEAMNELFSLFNRFGVSQANQLSEHFRKDVVNRAMKARGFVDYDVRWGTNSTADCAPLLASPVGVIGLAVQTHLEAAAQKLARKI